MMKMTIFGGFTLCSQDVQLDEKKLHSTKMIRLLGYILMHRTRDLTHQELIDTFWDGDDSKNPEGALKNLIYRLRAELKIFGEEELIRTVQGAYSWNRDFPVETDYEALERAAKKGKAADDVTQRRKYCEEVVTLYKKEMPSALATQSWFQSRAAYYRYLYMENARSLAAIYYQTEEYELLDDLCRAAMEVDMLDEDIHYWMIRSQIQQKKYEAAIECYENAKKQFYKNLGIRNVEKFNGLYEEILAITDNQSSDIDSLLHAVSEKEKPQGVFICEYPVFRDIYRVEARRIRRTGIAEYLLLITVRRPEATTSALQDAMARNGMQILENVLRRTLRTGDVASRYSSVQYAVLLPNCTFEGATIVSERVDRLFKEAAGKKRLMLRFEIEEIQERTERYDK